MSGSIVRQGITAGIVLAGAVINKNKAPVREATYATTKKVTEVAAAYFHVEEKATKEAQKNISVLITKQTEAHKDPFYEKNHRFVPLKFDKEMLVHVAFDKPKP